MITRLKYTKIQNGMTKIQTYHTIPKLAINADLIVQIVIDSNFNVVFERYPDYKRVYAVKASSLQQAKRKVRKQLEKMGLVFGVEIRQPRRKS